MLQLQRHFSDLYPALFLLSYIHINFDSNPERGNFDEVVVEKIKSKRFVKLIDERARGSTVSFMLLHTSMHVVAMNAKSGE